MNILRHPACSWFAASLSAALLLSAASPLRAASAFQAEQGRLYQYSTLDALSQGDFEGALTVSELGAHGDFGLGTFNHADGEMVMLDGKAYQVLSSGRVLRAEGDQRTPFAAVVSETSAPRWVRLDQCPDLPCLERSLDALTDSPNYFYAFYVEGTFEQIETRSVPAQNPPYPSLAEIAKHQSVFKRAQSEGTLIALRCPLWAKGINLPGYHCHFLNKARDFGGHVLSCGLSQGRVRVFCLKEYRLQLPDTPAFARDHLPISSNDADSLKRAEAAPARQ
jgi:acetolactate decarboxylase